MKRMCQIGVPTIGFFYKIRHYAALETFMLLYHGLFGSPLTYRINVWGLTYPFLTEKYIFFKKGSESHHR